MTKQATSGGFPLLRGIQLTKEVAELNMREAAAAALLSELWSDTFLTNAGINSGTSTGYTYRGASNYDVILQTAGTTIASETGEGTQAAELHSNPGRWGQGGLWTNSSGSDKTIAEVEISLSRLGSPTGNYVLNAYSVSAGLPNTLLSSSTPTSARASVSTSKTHYSFTLDTPQTVANGASIIFIFEYSGAQTGDGSNHIKMWGKGSAGTTITGVYKNSSDVYVAGGDAPYMILREAAPSSAVVKSVQITMPAAITSAIVWANTTGGNPDLVRISTDNGSTWTTVPTASIGKIVAVPSGTQVILEVTLSGSVELESWGVAGA